MASPIIDQSRKNTLWFMPDVYTGPSGTGANVPNVGDAIWDWGSGIWRVVGVDYYNTNLITKVRVSMDNLGGGISEDNTSSITGIGSNDNCFSIYVDTSVVPHVMNFDSRSRYFGSENSYVKVFYGVDISTETGIVVSAVMNQQGNIQSENIPLDNVIIPNVTNIAQKTPRSAHCSRTLNDGDIVTAVTYSASGAVTSIDKLVVRVTNYVRTLDQSTKYVSDIMIVSPFISKSDSRVIECPINMVTQSLSLRAKVVYTDGSSAEYPIDGTKFSLAGLTTYVANSVGQRCDLVLTYNLSKGELSFESTADNRIPRKYALVTTAVDSFYQLKIFAVPQWINNVYVLKWYLYNLDRKDIVDVTNYVEYGVSSPVFNGKLYNKTQSLQVAVNMKSINGAYTSFRHVQNLDINLLEPATATGVTSYFTMNYTENQRYGDNVKAVVSKGTVQNSYNLDMSCGLTDIKVWLNNLYSSVDPIYYSLEEQNPPTPTHARIIVNNSYQRVVPIADMLKPIPNLTTDIAQGSTVRVELHAVTGSDTFELAAIPFVAATL